MIVMCGYPCSGKTTRAGELKTFLEAEHDLRVNILGDHSENVIRNDLYSGMFRIYLISPKPRLPISLDSRLFIFNEYKMCDFNKLANNILWSMKIL